VCSLHLLLCFLLWFAQFFYRVLFRSSCYDQFVILTSQHEVGMVLRSASVP
jgi:hypothetical protein